MLFAKHDGVNDEGHGDAGERAGHGRGVHGGRGQGGGVQDHGVRGGRGTGGGRPGTGGNGSAHWPRRLRRGPGGGRASSRGRRAVAAADGYEPVGGVGTTGIVHWMGGKKEKEFAVVAH